MSGMSIAYALTPLTLRARKDSPSALRHLSTSFRPRLVLTIQLKALHFPTSPTTKDDKLGRIGCLFCGRMPMRGPGKCRIGPNFRILPIYSSPNAP